MHDLDPNSFGRMIVKFITTIFKSMFGLWFLTLVATRIYVFHNAYIHHVQLIEDERWLLRQCQDPAFFSNLKQHVSLCSQVEENKQRNTFLVALNETMTTVSMCGMVTCWDLMQYIQYGGLSFVATLSVICVLVVVVLIPVISLGLRMLNDRKYNMESMYACIERGGNMRNYENFYPHTYEIDAFDNFESKKKI
jgi:hypothetical protein